MATKMKGLFKGLRFISHIFDTSSKESDMQIGHPTDVKHLSHLGWDGPVSPPSWMKVFPTAPIVSSNPKEPVPPTSASKDLVRAVRHQSSSRSNANEVRLPPLSDNSSSGIDPVSHRPLVDDAVSSPPSHEPSESSTKPSRRGQTQGTLASDSSSNQDPPKSSRPQHSRPRRPREL